MTYRIIKILIIVLLLIATGKAWGQYGGGSGTAGSPFIISSATEFTAFVDDVNAGTNSNKYFKLTTDLSTNRIIGNSLRPFTGNFDGNGHTVTVTISASGGAGLFGNIGAGANIHDLIVMGTVTSTGNNAGGIVAYISNANNVKITNCINRATISSNGGQSIGGIIGAVNNLSTPANFAVVSGCVNSGTVTSEGTDQSYGYVGGIIGYGYFVNIINCTNTANITGPYGVGGISGYSHGVSGTTHAQIEDSYNRGIIHSRSIKWGCSGGIVAYSNYTDITNCHNESEVNSDAYYYGMSGCVGGIAGSFLGSSTTKLGKIEWCTNRGSITAKLNQVGGIVGSFDNLKISECINYADVICSSVGDASAWSVGGIAGGYSYIEMYNCGNVGNIVKSLGNSSYAVGGVVGELRNASVVMNCYNRASVYSDYSGNSTLYSSGGIVGIYSGSSSSRLTLENCYNTGTVYAKYHAGGIIGIAGYVDINNCYCGNTVSGTSYNAAIIGYASYSNVTYCYYRSGNLIGSSNNTTESNNKSFIHTSNTNTTCTISSTSLNGVTTTELWRILNAWVNNRSSYLKWVEDTELENLGMPKLAFCVPINVTLNDITSSYQRNELSWTANNPASSYTIYWGLNGNLGNMVTGQTSTTYNHTGLTNDIEYCYQVAAIGNGSTYCRYNARSNIQCGIPGCNLLNSPQPTLTINPLEIGDRTVKVRWNAVTGANSYTLYWGVNDPNVSTENVWKKTSISSSTREYDVERLTNGQLYKFAIMPVGSMDEGECEDNPLSPTVSATPNCE